MSVKGEPELLETLRFSHESVVPGYHLNKRHWVTITLGGDVDDARVRDLVEDSYDLVKPKRRKPARRRPRLPRDERARARVRAA